MKREIKSLEKLQWQAEYRRIGRIEQMIVDGLLAMSSRVFIPVNLITPFVRTTLELAGYNLSEGTYALPRGSTKKYYMLFLERIDDEHRRTHEKA